MSALGAPLLDGLLRLVRLLDAQEGREVQLSALSTLNKFGDRDVARVVLDAWPGMSPQTRSSAAEVGRYLRGEPLEAVANPEVLRRHP